MSTVTLEPESEFAETALRAAESGDAVTLIIGDAAFSIDIKPKGSATPYAELLTLTPEQIEANRAAIEETAGAWRGLVDTEELKADIRERRRTLDRGVNPDDVMAARNALQEMAGTWLEEYAAEFALYIRKRRREASHPPVCI